MAQHADASRGPVHDAGDLGHGQAADDAQQHGLGLLGRQLGDQLVDRALGAQAVEHGARGVAAVARVEASSKSSLSSASGALAGERAGGAR